MWVHRSQLCLNGKYTCISRQLLTEQLFLPVLRFVFKGKPHFSFLSSPARLVQAQRDCSTRQGSELFSTNRQEGAGCHRSWCFPLHYTTYHTHILVFWIILSSQQTLSFPITILSSQLHTLQYSKFGLPTVHKMFCISYFSYFPCWSESQGTEIPTQLCNRPSPTLSPHHNQSPETALDTLWSVGAQSSPSKAKHGFSSLTTWRRLTQWITQRI